MSELGRRVLMQLAMAGLSVDAAMGQPAAGLAPGAAPGGVRPISFAESEPTLTIAVMLTVLANKLDREHGFALDVLTFGGSSTLMIDAVVSGSAKFAAPGTLTALQAIRQGANLKIIGSISNNQLVTVINDTVLGKLGVSPTAPIAERMQALRGLTIATNPFGSGYYQVLRGYLKQYGLDPDKDLKVIGVGDSSALISGIKQGRFDAIASSSGIVEQAIAMQTGTLWISCPRGDIPKAQDAVVCVVVAREDTIEKSRADVDALRAALADALRAIHDENAATGSILQARYFPKFDPQVWDLTWKGLEKGGFPETLTYSRSAYEMMIAIDPKGAASYKDVSYDQIVYGPAQSL